MNKILITTIIIMAYSCQSISKPSTNPVANTTMTISNKSLAQQIHDDHFGDFFNYVIHEEVIEKIWQAAGSTTTALERIVLNKEVSTKARLIATEVLLQKEFTVVGEMDLKEVAQIYATALAENTTEMANSWGLLYKHDDKGPIGNFFGLLGEDALPALMELLDNQTMYLYHGSEEATVGNSYQFQVRDFAAYYISRILNEPSPYQENRAARNKEIERLRALAKSKLK